MGPDRMSTKYSRSPIWKYVEGAPSFKARCPRCSNTVEFQLAWDGEHFMFGLGWSWRVAVYRCPICPYYQDVPLKSVQQYLEKK